MIRARELQRAASTVSHTQLCNFFCHFTLISSCVPLHVAHYESASLLYNRTSFVVHLCLCACTVLPRHPQLHRASRHRLLLRHIAHPPLPSSVMPNSSPSLLPGFARSSFSISCALHHVASSSRLQLLPEFFSSLHHLLLVSVHLRQLAVAVARATPRALV